MALHLLWKCLFVLALLLLGILPSSCHLAVKAYVQEQQESQTAIVVNQLAILELLKGRQDAELTSSNCCTETSERVDRLEQQVEAVESQTSEIAEQQTGVLQMLQQLRSDLEASIAELKEELGKLNRTHSRTCVHPFFPLGTECFFINVHEKKTWHEARLQCQALGADLAEPQDFNAFLAMKRALVGDAYVWLGLFDAEQEGRWVGVSGNVVDMRSAPWFPGEPNNAYSGTEDYLHTWKNNLLNDARSISENNFACEYMPI